MGVNVLNLVRPVISYIPKVKKPDRKISFTERLTWTLGCLLIFLIFSQVPLFGIVSGDGSDPFFWVRIIVASNKGTMMELGITPIIMSGMVVQMLLGIGLIKLDENIRQDRLNYRAIEKLIAITITFGQALVQVKSGFYGVPSELGPLVSIIIILQLMVSGIILILIDELLEIGYGLGPGMSLFIATNICENIFWHALSPTTHITGRGVEFEGSIISFFHLLFTRKSKILALYEAFYRNNLPNLSNILSTALIFFTVMYLQGFRREIPLVSKNSDSNYGVYKVKLFYTSNMPIMLFSALVSNILFVSQLIYQKYPNSIVAKILGQWETTDFHNQLKAVSGIAYYITPPKSPYDAIENFPHFIIYLFFIVITCAITSRIWVEVSGSSAKDIVRSFNEQKITIRGCNESLVEELLTNIIEISATVSGILVALLSIIADLIGVIGSGTGILMAVTIICGYVETYIKENSDNKSLKLKIH